MPSTLVLSFCTEKEALDYINGKESANGTVEESEKIIISRPFEPDEELEYFEVHSDGGARGGNPGFAHDFTPDQPRFERWEKEGWKDVKNLELVKELYELGKEHNLECIPRKYEKGKKHYIPFAHGDKKNEDGLFENPYNKICDRLANIGIVDAIHNETENDSPIRLITNGDETKVN